VGAEVDDDKLELLYSNLKGKDLNEVLAVGRERFAVSGGGGGGGVVAAASGGGGGGGAAAAAAAPPAEVKEEKKEEKEESDDVSSKHFPYLLFLTACPHYLHSCLAF
jgi:large subunit ribosomal protein LP2